MEVEIGFAEKVTAEDSQALNVLADILEGDYDIQASRQKGELEPGVKDAGLTTALTIIGLSLTSIGTLISALTYWKDQQTKYSVTVKRGDVSILLGNVSKEEIQAVVRSLEKVESPHLNVLVESTD